MIPEQPARPDGAAALPAEEEAPAAPEAPVSGFQADRAEAVDGDGDVAAPEPPEQALEADIAELQAKASERDEYLTLAQRTQADFENYRKRTAKELSAAEGRGVAKFARELLPALDHLALALASADADDASLAEGIRLVQSELIAALGRTGVEEYSPAGERFDPEQHEAMAQHPVDGAEPGTIVEVYQQGYRLGDAVLRPARVVVAA
jgi:molecular chaperone GrpE